MTADTYRAGGELRIALSVKTQFVAGEEQSGTASPASRSTTGTRRWPTGAFAQTKPRSSRGRRSRVPVVPAGDGGQRRGSTRTWTRPGACRPRRNWGRAIREIGYSAFTTSGATPTNANETFEVYLDKVLASNLYFRLFGRLGTLVSDGTITLETPDGVVTAARDDRVREAGAEFGYQFRPGTDRGDGQLHDAPVALRDVWD